MVNNSTNIFQKDYQGVFPSSVPTNSYQGEVESDKENEDDSSKDSEDEK